jgi:hypothetical protein
MIIRAEDLGYWYLRLNGFLTTTNFIVHPDTGPNQETEVDVLGLRFPYRAENLIQPMRDDRLFTEGHDRPLVAIAEIKAGVCDLNGPWKDRDRNNMLRVMRAIGAFPSSEDERVAAALYDVGTYTSDAYRVLLVCMGSQQNTSLKERYPNIPQILWPHALTFIYRRFREYRRQKASHGQWNSIGKALWRTSQQMRTEAAFVESVQVVEEYAQPHDAPDQQQPASPPVASR